MLSGPVPGREDRSLAGRDRSHRAGLRGSLMRPLSGTGLSGKDRSPRDRSLRQGLVPERENSSARNGSSRGPVSPSWDRSLTAKMAQKEKKEKKKERKERKEKKKKWKEKSKKKKKVFFPLSFKLGQAWSLA
uniref:Uncharacterized protein n=1 Tax=Ananas comosus var. bracteatus TaxID=296719 RepID=A0A6V7PS43_ANACO|nr:unnamed protein product [Ananas comosus var. bracteatus]